ncbi:DeoR/GlpR family DNA-binding transcription regulator [Plantactinospora soyae]|uniref:Lactose phosphotransferase system repressor n=1 Tax=Plantactinospora soyae TaxID=1544732 RepID=A0A927R2M1_9ACTN|nr:DeoR/GlpR family DNA-binding transcription regulator [Plantactinospora soyae]MBE1492737.1 DeoR family fructose operon transcriptional repressor [Plantactinospora soyae]
MAADPPGTHERPAERPLDTPAGTNSRPPYADERRQHILQAVRSRGRVDAAELAGALGVTGETVRKDLIRLERNGLLRRVHGGAVPVESLSYEPAVPVRTGFRAEKERIARAALAHLPAYGSVLIDAGSTTALLAAMFPGHPELTVYTNALPIALALVGRPRLTVVTLGGRLRGPTLAQVDDWAVRGLAEINVDVAFLGTDGICLERGLTTPDPAEAAVKRQMVPSAKRRILLADHSKVGLVRGNRHADPRDIDLFITDSGLPDARRRELADAGLTVEYA